MLDIAELTSSAKYDSMKSTMSALRKRRREFSDDLEMQLTAVGMTPAARQTFDDALERRWQKAYPVETDYTGHDEIVVGGGLHAAIYCAARVQSGYAKPLVIERNRIGGSFALSRRPSFWLNSRNRPGEGGLPSENSALNYVPGAPVQMANLSASEFQTNADLAFVIRCTLAMYANVRMGTVTRAEYTFRLLGDDEPTFRRFGVELDDGSRIFADRIIDARGLGDPRADIYTDKSERIMSFRAFLASMDQPFPLQGMRRVAVVGGGNSALCAAEALLGISPSTGLSVPMLDWLEQVDLYNADLPDTCEEWRSEMRGRYQALGSFLKPIDNGMQRLRVFKQSGVVTPGFGSTFVNGRTYDRVIMATGWRMPSISGGLFASESDEFGFAPPLALQWDEDEVYSIGPAANLSFDAFESDMSTSRIDENRVALFRLGNRTAALAARLSGAKVSVPPTDWRALLGLRKEAKPKPKKLGKLVGTDRFGVDIRIGARVRYDEGNGEELYTFEATVVEDRRESSAYPFAVKRDDGITGGGSDGGWIVNAENAKRFLTVL